MAYSNDLEQIRSGLINYIGTIQSVVPFEGRAKNQIVASILVDETLNVAKTQQGSHYCDPYVLVPMFKGIIGVLRQQQQVLKRDGKNEEDKQRIIRYEAIIEEFEDLIRDNSPKTAG